MSTGLDFGEAAMLSTQSMANKAAQSSRKTTGNTPQERIVSAGRQLFFTQGFEKVSTEQLAREAGVSKATLYKYFGDMVGVLRAVVEAESLTFEPKSGPMPESADALHLALVDYGTRVLTFLNQRDILQFSALMHEEARNHPDVARTFYETAYGRALELITKFLRHGQEAGYLRTDLEAAELAEQLIGMWEGLGLTRAHLGVLHPPFPDPEGWSRKCVATLIGAPESQDMVR